MLPLAVILVVRAFMSASITTFLPTYLNEQGAELWLAVASLSLYQCQWVGTNSDFAMVGLRCDFNDARHYGTGAAELPR